jgi:small subunit ribosomal protein S17
MAILGDKNIKELRGVVLSNKGDKTIVVEVVTVKKHPLLKKRFKTQKKYYAHDELNQANQGDLVLIRQTRPLSKLKRRKLISVERVAQVA